MGRRKEIYGGIRTIISAMNVSLPCELQQTMKQMPLESSDVYVSIKPLISSELFYSVYIYIFSFSYCSGIFCTFLDSHLSCYPAACAYKYCAALFLSNTKSVLILLIRVALRSAVPAAAISHRCFSVLYSFLRQGSRERSRGTCRPITLSCIIIMALWDRPRRRKRS